MLPLVEATMQDPMSFGLNLTAVGLAIVFAVLTLIALIVVVVGKLDARWRAQEEKKKAEALDREPTIDNTTAVLIAAAVATYVGGRYRVRSVRRLISSDPTSSTWSAQGRAVLQGSHVITRKRGEGA